MFNFRWKTNSSHRSYGRIRRRNCKAFSFARSFGCIVLVQGLKKLEALANELGDRSYAIKCNLSDGDAVDKLPEEVNALLGGPVDILLQMLV